jgi:hypothetical protein
MTDRRDVPVFIGMAIAACLIIILAVVLFGGHPH